MNVTFELPADAQQRLRELRLWHWREALAQRKMAHGVAASHNSTSSMGHIYAARYANDLHAKADMHIGFVQTLNDFFPIGDTAEKDDES